jgi:hypothetical protein
MKELHQLIESIERFEPDSADRDAAIQRIHHNRDHFSTLLDSTADFLSLSRNIYRWYLEEHKRARRRGNPSVYWDPLAKPERISVIVPPLRRPTRQAYKNQSLIIGRNISSLNKGIANESRSSLPARSPDDPAIEERHGLKFDTRRQRVCVDGIWESITDDQCKFWAMVWDADGKWVPGSSIGERAPQIKYSFPKRLKDEIKGHQNQGYCLKRFRSS